jgi:hypothetical protein
MSIGVSRAKIHVAGEYPVQRAVRDIVQLKEPDARTGATHQGFVLWQGLALLVAATSENAAVWYHWNIPLGRMRALMREEEGLRTFEIGVAFGLGPRRTVTIVAEEAMEAMIIGLCELGLTALTLVTGITICEL